MQVWPDDVDTPAVKGSRHLEGPSGWLECWGGRSCSEDRNDALGWAFPMWSGGRGRWATPEVKCVRKGRPAGRTGRGSFGSRRSAEQTLGTRARLWPSGRSIEGATPAVRGSGD